MKKFYLLLLTLLATVAASANPTLYLRGADTGWEAQENYKFTENNGVYTLHLDRLSGIFKIADANWGYQMGANGGKVIESGVSFILDWVGTDNNLSLNQDPAADVTLTLVLETRELTVTFSANTDPVSYDYFIRGTIFNGSWSNQKLEKQEDGSYMAECDAVSGIFGIMVAYQGTQTQVAWINGDGVSEIKCGETVNLVLERDGSSNLNFNESGKFRFVFTPETNGNDVPTRATIEITEIVVPVEAVDYNIVFFKNTKNWSTVNAYVWDGSANNGWPGQKAQKAEGIEGDVYYFTYDPDKYKNILFNNGMDGDANKTGDLSLVGNHNKFFDASNSSAQDLDFDTSNFTLPAVDFGFKMENGQYVGNGAHLNRPNDLTFYTANETANIIVKVPAGHKVFYFMTEEPVSVQTESAPAKAAAQGFTETSNGTVPVKYGHAGNLSIYTEHAGYKTPVQDFRYNVMSDEPTTGVDAVEVENAPVEYYNLQGVRVANPRGGVFIRVQGNKVTKVAL